MKSDDELRNLFDESNENKGDNDALVCDTGFRKPLCLLTLDDRESVKRAIQDHHTLLKIKPELDQLCEGLKALGVLDSMKKFPQIMKTLFCRQEEKLSKGNAMSNIFKAIKQSNCRAP